MESEISNDFVDLDLNKCSGEDSIGCVDGCTEKEEDEIAAID